MTDRPNSTQRDKMDEKERLRQRLGPPDPRQGAIWREMTPACRLDVVGQI